MQKLTMNSNRQAVVALAVSVILMGVAGFLPGKAVAEDKNKGQTVSKELGKPLKAAQDLLQQKKYADALVKLKDADGMPKKTPWDQHVINQLEGYAYGKLSNFPEASKAYEAQISDGFTSPEDANKLVIGVAEMNYQLKNYDKAIDYGNRAIKGGFADEQMYTIVGQSYYLKSDWKGALKFYDSLIESEIKQGKTPKDEQLQLALSSCVKLQDNDCTTRELERLVSYYPKTEYWQNLLYTMRTSQGSDKQNLQLYRLMLEVDVLKNPEDYTEMAQLAIEQGSPGEAQHVLEKGFAKNVFTDQRLKDKNQRLLESAKKAAAADLATLPKVAQDAEASSTGDKDVGVGLAYLGYQQYDKSVDALNKGLTKGGVKNEPEARLLLGIAQLKAGHKDDAVKAFHSVKGDPKLERLADLWSLHAKQA
jgi:tetratricopeptide (TPR) repeat protein